MVNQTKLRAFRTTPVYKFGYLGPRNHDQAVELDAKNGNQKWQDAEDTEIHQLFDYQTFFDKNSYSIWIQNHVVYGSVKLRHPHCLNLGAGILNHPAAQTQKFLRAGFMGFLFFSGRLKFCNQRGRKLLATLL